MLATVPRKLDVMSVVLFSTLRESVLRKISWKKRLSKHQLRQMLAASVVRMVILLAIVPPALHLPLELATSVAKLDILLVIAPLTQMPAQSVARMAILLEIAPLTQIPAISVVRMAILLAIVPPALHLPLELAISVAKLDILLEIAPLTQMPALNVAKVDILLVNVQAKSIATTVINLDTLLGNVLYQRKGDTRPLFIGQQ